MAGQVLSSSFAASSRARVRLALIRFHRDQWDFLLSPTAGEFCKMVCRGAARFPFFDQSTTIHHAHSPVEGSEGTPRKFFASGLLRLGSKLGPILWQLPPNFRFDRVRIESFFKLLPRDAEAAVALARRHDKTVSGRSWMKIEANRPLRHCMEIRNTTFQVPEFIELLRAYNVGLVCADR
jgi:hypothetical protein